MLKKSCGLKQKLGVNILFENNDFDGATSEMSTFKKSLFPMVHNDGNALFLKCSFPMVWQKINKEKEIKR